MHERLLAEELVEQAVAQARERGIGRIDRIVVSLGADSHVTAEALSFWFDLVKAGTMAEQARLKVDKIDSGEGKNCILLVSLQGEALDAHKRSHNRPRTSQG